MSGRNKPLEMVLAFGAGVVAQLLWWLFWPVRKIVERRKR